MELTYRIDGIDCANCASKLERAIAKLPGVQQAQLNFLTGRLVVSAASDAVHEIDIRIVCKNVSRMRRCVVRKMQ